ncbi:hypothetical protein IWT30_01666 [Secundilactobacillus mixtipabuli]|uniref:Uncharacterized protein n=1 Tax=Secundilactobacillus mixtipabuli TaxID=1435342 RepID=A0A1Z5ID64_9LACO|nr:hypothetical protein IWT30_01666 [Secundilactobacillus mixtipabuli]
MFFKRIVMLGVTALSLGTAGVALAQPVDAHAATSIPSRFRHTWQGNSHGTLYTLKIHKYYGRLHQSSEWNDYLNNVHFKKYSKNHYRVYFKKTAQPLELYYVNSHKVHLVYGPGRHAYISMSRI